MTESARDSRDALAFFFRGAALAAAFIGCGLLLAAAGLRFILPAFLEGGGAALQQVVAELLPGHRARIGEASIRLGWGGLFVRVSDFELIAPDGEAVMRFERAAARWNAPRDVFFGDDDDAHPLLASANIVVDNPVFYLRRDEGGKWRGALPPLSGGGDGRSGKRKIGEGVAVLRNARIEMRDDLQRLPPLIADGVNIAARLQANGDIAFRIGADAAATLNIGDAPFARGLTLAALIVASPTAQGRFYAAADDLQWPLADAPPGEWRDLRAQVWGEFGDGEAGVTVYAAAANAEFDSAEISAAADALTVQAQARLAGGLLSGASGAAVPNLQKIAFGAALTSGGEFIFPGVFLHPLRFDRIAAAGEWRRGASPDGWSFSLSRAFAENDDASAHLSGAFAGAAHQLDIMDIAGRLPQMRADAVHRYLPAAIDLESREWLRDALAGGGELFNWTFHAAGAPEDFPYGGDAQGAFYLGGAFADVRLAYTPGWPPLQNAAGTVAFDNEALSFVGRGDIHPITVSRVQGGVADLTQDAPTLSLIVQTAAQAEDYLAARTRFPPTRDIFANEEPPQISGRAALAISAQVPLADEEDEKYRGALLLQNGQARIEGLDFQTVAATMFFADDNLRGEASADLLDEEVAITFAISPARREARLSGRFDAARAAAAMDAPEAIAAIAGGIAQATVHYERRGEELSVFFASDLDGVSVALPAPLGKNAAEKTPLELEWRGGGEVKVNFKDGLAQARLASGGALIGFNRPPPETAAVADIGIYGYLDELHLDEWLDWELPRAAGGDDDGGEIQLGEVALTVANAEFFSIHHQTLDLQVTPHKSAAQTVIVLQSDKTAGRARWQKNRLDISLSHLLLPEGEDEEPLAAEDEIASPPPDLAAAARLPAISLTVGRLEYGRRRLGPLRLRGYPSPKRGWRVAALQIGEGENTIRAGGHIAGGRTRLSVAVAADDAPGFFADLGYPDLLVSGEFTMGGMLDWRGGLLDVKPRLLNGDLALSCRDVRYAEAEPGAAKLLALFSPQSLFSLGFADALGEGVVFRQIQGDIQVQSGIARARELRLESEEAVVTMTGLADLARQTYAIRGRVRPGKSSLGLVTLVTAAEPTTALITWVLGKIFEKPISEIGAYDFTVVGPWDAPVYEEVGALPPESIP